MTVRHAGRRPELTEAEASRVAEVFQEHRGFIESVARRHAVTPDAVPDIVQTVGLKVCQYLNGFRGESHVRTWLFRVTVNVARANCSEFQRLTRVQDAMLERPEPDRVVDPDEHVMVSRRLEALSAAVQQLRPLFREAVTEGFGNETEARTIQSDQNVKKSSLRARRYRARQQLRSILGAP